MSFVTSLTTKLTQQDMSESWEDKYPNEWPLWLNIVGWPFVLVPFFFI